MNVDVATTAAEVEELRPVWERLGGSHLSADLDFFLAHVRHAPLVERPHVVVLEKGGQPIGLAVGRLEATRTPTRLGYAMVFNPHIRSLTVVYGGLLAENEAEMADLVAAVGRSVENGAVDVIRLRMLTVGSGAHERARTGLPFLRREHFRRPVRHWRSTVPGSMDDFLAARSKERRRHVRRYTRRLEEAYNGEVEIGRLHTREELDRLFADSHEVHRRTYQARLGVGFSRGELNRRLTEACADRGWFRGYVLYLRGKPVAFWHGNVYAGTFWSIATGYDPAHGEDRPGTYLLMRVVEDLCADQSVDTLDFGFGDAEYKRHFGDRSWLEEDVAVFVPRPRPIAVNLGLSAIRGTARSGQALVERTGRVTDVRRRWRARLNGRATPEGAP